MKTRQIIRLSLVVTFFLVCLGGLLYLFLAPGTASTGGVCQEVTITVRGEEGGEALFLSPERIQEELSQRGVSLKGKPLDSIDLRHIEQVLLRLPIYKHAEAYVSRATSSVQIRLTEKLPLFIVFEPSGKSYYVTQGKDTFAVSPSFAAYLPVVSGDVTRELATGTVYDLLKVVRQDPYFADYFGQVYVDRDAGISLIPRVGTTRLILGHDGPWDVKLRKWRIFAESVLPKRGMNAFAYVRLDYSDQIVAGQRYPAKGQEDEELSSPTPAPVKPATQAEKKPVTPPAKKTDAKAEAKKPESKKAPEKKPAKAQETKKPTKEKASDAKKTPAKPEAKKPAPSKGASTKEKPSTTKPTSKPTSPSQKKK